MSLMLRPWSEDDAPALFDIYRREPDLGRQMPELNDVEDARILLWSRRGNGWPFALVEDGAICGNVWASTVDRTHSTAWFSYWLVASARGRGLAARAAARVADHALFDVPEPVFRLELGHRVENPASGAVARRAGFVLEGRERSKLLYDGVRYDTLVYSRLQTDPRPDYEPIELRTS